MNKKLLVLIVVILFLLALILVGIFAFKISKVEITIVEKVNDGHQDSIGGVAVSDVQAFVDEKLGKNILFFNETIFKKEIEQKYKNIKVIDAKRQFPNVVQLFIEERQEVFAIERIVDDNTKYFVLDKYLNVLREQNNYRNTNDNANPDRAKNLVLIENVAQNEIEVLQIGEKLKLNNLAKQKALDEISNAFFGNERLEGYNDSQRIMSTFYSIDLENVKSLAMYTKTGVDEERALKIEFTSDAKNLLLQLQVGLGAYQALDESSRNKGKLVIVYDTKAKSYYVVDQTERTTT